MKISRLIRILPVTVLFFALPQRAQGLNYNLEGFAWPAGSNVVMKLGLGSIPVALQASAADALDIWNGYLDFITITSVSSPTVPRASGDGINSVFLSSTVFGDGFGDLTLAVSVLLTDVSGTVTTEGDVVVNSAYHYDSYRGPQQANAFDIHRILLHEFGHVLGLAHSGTSGGLVIMDPLISDLDHPVSDDVAGVPIFLPGGRSRSAITS